jgi:ABC-type dipeptide/oligopeptide/nickel transport system permease component
MNKINPAMILRRIVAIPVAIFVIASLAFLLMRATGGNAASALAGEYADDEAIAAIRAELGLDRPLGEQYIDFIVRLAQGDLGISYYSNTPVVDEILRRLPLDLFIGVLAMGIAVVLGVMMGAVAGYFRDRLPDGIVRVIVSTLQSIPDYVFALASIFVFFFLLQSVPAPTGQLPTTVLPPVAVTNVAVIDAMLAGDWRLAGMAAHQMLLPVLSMGIVLSAAFAKVVRTGFISTLASPQSEYSAAMGIAPGRRLRSIYRMSQTAVFTTVAILVGAILGGGAINQKIFALDGAAAYGVDAIFRVDLPAIQGIVIIFGGLAVVAFLLIDIVILLTDARVRNGERT